ncbi:hypothetical protein F7734_00825 [Scytonema sp. UIC 10036]|uniref:hypothetical protein n=1 Tax=Scytonema sp. UIC 10036 TaxID=2304196 RepID=UPI0012DA7F78|nr:hypothetical protein [Scytonema sp. UIC 10036]MUG91119.1 hypothetical protein [Scytonema sp. UIC 10036]
MGFQEKPQAKDTSVEADVYFFNKLRQLSLKQRIELYATHDRGVKKLCLIGIKWRHRNAQLDEIRLFFTRAVLAEKFSPDFKPTSRDETMWIQDSIALAGTLHLLLESINVPYYISGGVASSIHGEARSTRGLDLVIQIKVSQIDFLVQTLEAAGYYCPAGAVEDMKQEREKTLSITHMETIANADLIVMDNSSPFAISQMSRRILLDVEGMQEFWIASPEDLILQKLLWGKGSRSEKQWRDVLGILKLQSGNLNYIYLTEWAERLNIFDELEQALTEAGIL